MPIQTGTHTIADLARNTFSGELVVPDNIGAMDDAIRRDLEMHNARTREMMAVLAEVSPERSTVYGTNAEGEFHSADEFSRGPTQKIRRGAKVEFPLDKFQFAVGWTADYLRRATVQDMALKTIAARQADLRNIQNRIRDAFFGPTNYTWVDRIVDNNDLAVKRLVNADSASIPNGPNGETFDGSTHTHYLASDWADEYADADSKGEDVEDMVQTVIEHGHSDGFEIYINQAQAGTFRTGLTGFLGLIYPNTVAAPGSTADRGQGTLDITRADNRLIGYFNGHPVWTKPWVPANYILATATMDPGKPLRFRTSTVSTEANGLFIAGEIVTHPLQAQYMEHFFGAGVKTRTNGSVLYIASDTYTAPTF